jgi:1-acyl-sn-glycerol-3-phosphate acyltransferase
MTVDLSAQLLLTSYLLIGAVVVVWQARRYQAGWQAWMILLFLRLYCRCGFRWRANRHCPFPLSGPAIILANHRCPLDPFFLGVEIVRDRVIGYLTAKEFYEKPGLHWVCSHMHSIPVERDGSDMASARAALRRLLAGELLGVFPEGRINTGTDLLPANPGLAWLALRSKAPVYPTFIHNSPLTLNMVEPFYTFNKVRVTYGDPVDLSAYYSRPLSSELLREVTNVLMQRLAELGGVSATSCEPVAK